ncbi:unnamed protein product [Durusdinium trenchii]|uniref:Uncharacterized protein n=1 Tax=Durusdinium trenchii TaxID=1381693 RepID=A0ABP0HQ13_9DINO
MPVPEGKDLDALMYRLLRMKCPKVLASIILCLLWTTTVDFNEEYEMLEFFAGAGNLSRYMKLCGRRTGSLDIKYQTNPSKKSAFKSDPMDILSPSGFAVALACLFKCRPDRFMAMFALKCASWTAINSGTSNRAPCASIGFDEYPNVLEANALCERTIYLLVVVVCLGGVFGLEQPRLSNFEFYPMFLEEYTVQFGRCLADLYDEMVISPCGQPKLPCLLPPAQESYQFMGQGFDLGYARLNEVYSYLRRGRNLKIPPGWSHLLPKPE